MKTMKIPFLIIQIISIFPFQSLGNTDVYPLLEKSQFGTKLPNALASVRQGVNLENQLAAIFRGVAYGQKTSTEMVELTTTTVSLPPIRPSQEAEREDATTRVKLKNLTIEAEPVYFYHDNVNLKNIEVKNNKSIDPAPNDRYVYTNNNEKFSVDLIWQVYSFIFISLHLIICITCITILILFLINNCSHIFSIIPFVFIIIGSSCMIYILSCNVIDSDPWLEFTCKVVMPFSMCCILLALSTYVCNLYDISKQANFVFEYHLFVFSFCLCAILTTVIALLEIIHDQNKSKLWILFLQLAFKSALLLLNGVFYVIYVVLYKHIFWYASLQNTLSSYQKSKWINTKNNFMNKYMYNNLPCSVRLCLVSSIIALILIICYCFQMFHFTIGNIEKIAWFHVSYHIFLRTSEVVIEISTIIGYTFSLSSSLPETAGRTKSNENSKFIAFLLPPSLRGNRNNKKSPKSSDSRNLPDHSIEFSPNHIRHYSNNKALAKEELIYRHSKSWMITENGYCAPPSWNDDNYNEFPREEACKYALGEDSCKTLPKEGYVCDIPKSYNKKITVLKSQTLSPNRRLQEKFYQNNGNGDALAYYV